MKILLSCCWIRANFDFCREEAEQKSKSDEAQQLIAKLQEEIRESVDKVKKVEQELTMLRNTVTQFRDMKKEKDRTIYHLTEGISNIAFPNLFIRFSTLQLLTTCILGANERQMGSLKNSDDLSMYAQWMPALVKRIDEAVKQKRFSKPPRGPLGKYTFFK